MSKVCVLGSINMDVVLRVNSIPIPGETVLAKDFKKNAGGKGANQAIAAARLGAEVSMIGKVGKDENGEILVNSLEKEGIDAKYIFHDDKNLTGTAIINVDDNADNSIVVVSGANMAVTLADIDKSREIIQKSDIVIAQFETNMKCIEYAFRIAKEYGKFTILNPAPSNKCSNELLKYTDMIIPNQHEAFDITGVKIEDDKTAELCGKKLLEKGIQYVILTLGSKGAMLVTCDKSEIIPANKVKAVDTTAAGDTFIGALSSKLSNSTLSFEFIKECIVFANKASAITVQRRGAQPSIPTLKEV